MNEPGSRFPLVQLRNVSAVPITNGLGEAGDPANDGAWPRYIRTTDIAAVRVLDANKRVTLPPDVARHAPVLRGDILMTSAGATVGKSYLHQTDETACFAGYLSRLRVRPDRALPEFVAYWTESPHYLDQVQSGAVKSTIENFSAAKYRAMWMPLPPLEEQRAIADYLDRETAQIDAFIAKNEELIALLTERRAAIVSRRVAQGLNPDAPMAETVVDGLGLVPAHWKVERFARVAKIRGGLLDPSDSRFESWALIAPNHIRSASGELLELVPASEQSAESGKYPVKKGDVVYSKIRPALAKAVIAPEDCLCSADMYGITSRSSDVLDNRYLRWQMLSKWFTEWATERSMRVAMPKVNQDTLSAAPIIVPPIQEQRDIVERIEAEVEAVDAAVGVARRSVELARERRAALISAAVTGKIDVGVGA